LQEGAAIVALDEIDTEPVGCGTKLVPDLYYKRDLQEGSPIAEHKTERRLLGYGPSLSRVDSESEFDFYLVIFSLRSAAVQRHVSHDRRDPSWEDTLLLMDRLSDRSSVHVLCFGGETDMVALVPQQPRRGMGYERLIRAAMWNASSRACGRAGGKRCYLYVLNLTGDLRGVRSSTGLGLGARP
jgi:hypothetical protein